MNFDKDGWWIPGILNKKIDHSDDHLFIKPNPHKKIVLKKGIKPRGKYIRNLKYDKKKYKRYGHAHLDLVDDTTSETIPLHETTYKGSKYEQYNNEHSGAMVIVAKSKKSEKKLIIYFLIPRKEVENNESKKI